MNNPDYIKKKIFSKSNFCVILGAYILTAIYLSSQVLSEGNLAAPDLISKVILLMVVIFIASPAFAIGSLIMKLRIQHFIATNNIYEFVMPTKGSLGNPDFSIYMGTKAKALWRIFIVTLIVFLIAIFAFYIGKEIL